MFRFKRTNADMLAVTGSVDMLVVTSSVDILALTNSVYNWCKRLDEDCLSLFVASCIHAFMYIGD